VAPSPAPWISPASGAAIFVVVLAFQLLSDGLQEVFARRAGEEHGSRSK
jgi:ABC-type dipeptide/oligopeptide/nickel transport system permease subunit